MVISLKCARVMTLIMCLVKCFMMVYFTFAADTDANCKLQVLMVDGIAFVMSVFRGGFNLLVLEKYYCRVYLHLSVADLLLFRVVISYATF